MQMGEKSKSKIELEQQKRIERAELEKLYDYNPFGRSGSGAPLKDSKGNTLSGRKTLENNLWKEAGNPYERQFSQQPSSLQPNQIYNPQLIPNTIYPQPQIIAPKFAPYQPIIPQQQNPYYMEPIRFFNPSEIQPYNPQFMLHDPNYNKTFLPQQVFPQTDPRYAYLPTLDQYSIPSIPTQRYSHYQEPLSRTTSRQGDPNEYIPPESGRESQPLQVQSAPKGQNQPPAKSITQEENEKIKRMNYQNVLLLQIEENKRRKESEKQILWEANRLEDQKIREYNEKLNETSKKEHEKRLRLVNKSKEEDEKNAQSQNLNNPKLVHSPNKSQRRKESPEHLMIHPRSPQEDQIQNYQQPYQQQYQQPPQYFNEVRDFQSKIGISFDNINRVVNDTLNDQIRILRSEVQKNHKDLNDLIFNIHSDSRDAYQVKYEAERELSKIKDQLEKRKINDFVYEKKINEVLEKNNPYGNLQVNMNNYRQAFKPFSPNGNNQFNEELNFNEQNQNPYINKQNNRDLASSSTMIYSKEELINEKYDYNEKISKLANVGKSLMGDTQFVPITEPKRAKYNSEANVNNGNLGETYYSFKARDEGNSSATPNFQNNGQGAKDIFDFQSGNNSSPGATFYNKGKARNAYGDVMNTFELNNQIDEIAMITYKNDPKAKFEALNKKIQYDLNNIEKDNSRIEYYDPKKFSRKVDFSKLDNMLNSIIDEDTREKELQAKMLVKNDGQKVSENKKIEDREIKEKPISNSNSEEKSKEAKNENKPSNNEKKEGDKEKTSTEKVKGEEAKEKSGTEKNEKTNSKEENKKGKDGEKSKPADQNNKSDEQDKSKQNANINKDPKDTDKSKQGPNAGKDPKEADKSKQNANINKDPKDKDKSKQVENTGKDPKDLDKTKQGPNAGKDAKEADKTKQGSGKEGEKEKIKEENKAKDGKSVDESKNKSGTNNSDNKNKSANSDKTSDSNKNVNSSKDENKANANNQPKEENKSDKSLEKSNDKSNFPLKKEDNSAKSISTNNNTAKDKKSETEDKNKDSKLTANKEKVDKLDSTTPKKKK